MDRISRALISFAFVADRFEATKGDIFQGLVPLFAPIVHSRANQDFDPATFAEDIRNRYDIVMPVPVAQDWAPRLEKEGYLERDEISPGYIRYRYKLLNVEIDGPFEEKVKSLLAEFISFVSKNPARADIPDSLDLEKEFGTCQ